MQQVYGMKVIVLTRGGLTDVWKEREFEARLKKICCENSAEVVVPDPSTGPGKDRTLKRENQ
jgi:hypothetical protein